MAMSTDDPTGKASVSTELKIEDKPDLPAQPDSAEDQKVADKETSSADGSALFFETFSKGNKEHAEVGLHEDPADKADTEETIATIKGETIQGDDNIAPAEPGGTDGEGSGEPGDIEPLESEDIPGHPESDREDPADDTDTEETVAPIKGEILQGDDNIAPAESGGTGEQGLVEPVDIEPLESEDIPDHPESDRKEEVTALLGMEMISDDEEAKILPDEEEVDQATASVDTANNEDETDKVASSAINAESGNNAEEHAAAAAELKIILESLQDSLANTQYISSKIDAVSGDTEGLVKQVNSISLNYELLSAEMEAITSSANSKNFLSKTFLIIASLAVALLVIFQIYSFISLVQIQRLQNAAGTTVLEKISVLNKKMADYDKNLTKALENPAQQGHGQMNPDTAEKTNQESAGNKEVGSANNTPVLEKMNRLRNGLLEKRLIRKETGDWFVYNKKNEESISDVEVIEVLNQAYKKIGRSLSPTVPLPSHKALCILKPDGKGGTEVVMTKEFTP